MSVYFPSIKEYNDLSTLDYWLFYPQIANRKGNGSLDDLPRKVKMSDLITFLEDKLTVTSVATITLQEEGTNVNTNFDTLNFVGTNVTVTDGGSGIGIVTITGGTDTNFANNNLTFDANRDHTLSIYDYHILGSTGEIHYTMTNVPNLSQFFIDQDVVYLSATDSSDVASIYVHKYGDIVLNATADLILQTLPPTNNSATVVLTRNTVSGRLELRDVSSFPDTNTNFVNTNLTGVANRTHTFNAFSVFMNFTSGDFDFDFVNGTDSADVQFAAEELLLYQTNSTHSTRFDITNGVASITSSKPLQIINTDTASGGELVFREGTINGTQGVTLKAPASLAGNITFTLPTAVPSSNDSFIAVDTSGNMSFKKALETFIIACSDETTDLTTGTNKVTFRMPYAFTVSAVRASLSTVATGSTVIVDINESGTSILSTKLSIDASEKTSTTAATPAVISDTSLADDAEITIDIDQVGSTTAGKGLKVYIIGRKQ